MQHVERTPELGDALILARDTIAQGHSGDPADELRNTVLVCPARHCYRQWK
ncbi:hypothetical protein D3C76_1738220 [compost metagenome]